MNIYDVSPVVRFIYPKLAALASGLAETVLIVPSYKPVWLVINLVALPTYVLAKRATCLKRIITRIVNSHLG